MTTPAILTDEPETLPIALTEVEEGEKFSILKFETDKDLNDALDSAGRALQYLDELRGFVLKRTKPMDWTNQSGNPYFGEAGCNRFAAPFQMFEKDVTAWSIDVDGNRREVTEKNMFSGDIRIFFFSGIIGSRLLNVEASFEGGSRIGDGFREKDDLLFYFQKAKANWRGRGYRKILGMENMTWDELKVAAITPENVKQIDRQTTAKAESDEAKEAWKMVLEFSDGDPKKAEDWLFTLTNSDKYKGKRRPAHFTDAQMKWVMPKIKSEWAKRFPEKAAAKAQDKPANGDYTAFQKSVVALSGKLNEADYKAVLTEWNIADPVELPADKHNAFLLALKERSEKGAK